MRALRYICLFFLLLLVLGVVALASLYAYVRSDSGLDRIAREVSARASSDTMRITLSGLRGDLLDTLTLDHLALADRDGVWLELQGVTVAWSPRALLHNEPPLRAVSAKAISVLRAPAPGNAEDTAGSDSSLAPYARYLPGTLRIDALHINEAVAGVEQEMRIEGAGDAQRYRLALTTLTGVPLSLDAMLQPQQEDFAAKITFKEEAGGIVAALLGLPNTIPLSLDADVTANSKGDMRIDTAGLRAGTLQLDASGTYSVSGNHADIRLSVNVPDMDVPQALSGIPMSGSAGLSLTAKGTPDALAVTLSANVPHLVIEDHRIESLQLHVEGTLNPGAWGSDAFAAQGITRAEGRYNGTDISLQAKGDGANGRVTLESLAARYGVYTLDGKGEGKGSIARFDLASAMALHTPDGTSTLTLGGTVDSEAERYTGDITGEFHHGAYRFDLASTLDADARKAEISTLSLKGDSVDVTGKATIFIPEQLADAALTVRASDLAPLGKLLAMPLSGALSGDVTLARSGNAQRAKVNAEAKNISLPGLRMAAVKIQAQAEDAKALEGLDIALQANGIAHDTAQVASLQAQAKGGLKPGLTVSLKSEGTLERKPWTFALSGKAQQPQAQHYRLDLATFEGLFDGAPIRMASPVTLIHQPTKSSLSPLTLQLAGGTFTADAMIEGTKVSGKVTASSIALQKLPAAGLPEATLNASLTLGGTVSSPVLAWDATMEGMFDTLPLTLTATGGWKERSLRTELSMKAKEARALASLTLPAQLSLQPFATDIGDTTTLAGKVNASLPLSMFNAGLRADGHRLGGTFAGDATLAGTFGAPHFEGAFTLADGRYDHATTGICLRNITARISGNKQAVQLDELAATDSNKRRFTANARLALGGTPTLSGDAHFDRFRLFCGGMMNGQLDGTLTARGTTRAMTVAGTLTLGPLNIQIPGARVSSNIPEVEAVWVTPDEATEDTDEPSVIALDITLDAPRQLFIRGRGLDAEFKGALAITGTTSTPKLDGQFDKQRGTFTLLDRVLALDTASVLFKGPMPPSPFLTVSASTKVNATTITVALSGNAVKPKLTLSSSPTLPQDELLALLLFGRQLDRISPFEALQLAQAARTLAGLDGGGPGIIGSVRDALGLDRLEVGADESSNVNVSTGKYVTDDVYVGVTQGAKPEDRKVTTEITLTPSVLGKTSVDGIGNQSVGVEWKRDY